MARKKAHKKKQIPASDKLTQVYLTQYEITEEPIQEPEYQRLPEAVKEQLEGLYDLAQSRPKQAIPALLELKEKYPRVPQIYNFLAAAYSHAGEKEKAEQWIHENLRMTPDYLFARINQAQLFLAKGELDRIPAVFDHKYDLKMLYPERNKFHITEVANFMGIMGLYFARTGQRDVAQTYHAILQEIAPDFPISQALHRELNPGRITPGRKRLFGE